METNPLPDGSTPWGERLHRRLREDHEIWLTTVGRDGAPQPNPVWFLWDGASVLIYNAAGAQRLVHVRERPLVALHFDSGGGPGGAGVVVVKGRAHLPDDQPAANEVAEFLAKYGQRMFGTPEQWAAMFPVPMRIHPLWARGHLPAHDAPR